MLAILQSIAYSETDSFDIDFDIAGSTQILFKRNTCSDVIKN